VAHAIAVNILDPSPVSLDRLGAVDAAQSSHSTAQMQVECKYEVRRRSSGPNRFNA